MLSDIISSNFNAWSYYYKTVIRPSYIDIEDKENNYEIYELIECI